MVREKDTMQISLLFLLVLNSLCVMVLPSPILHDADKRLATNQVEMLEHQQDQLSWIQKSSSLIHGSNEVVHVQTAKCDDADCEANGEASGAVEPRETAVTPNMETNDTVGGVDMDGDEIELVEGVEGNTEPVEDHAEPTENKEEFSDTTAEEQLGQRETEAEEEPLEEHYSTSTEAEQQAAPKEMVTVEVITAPVDASTIVVEQAEDGVQNDEPALTEVSPPAIPTISNALTPQVEMPIAAINPVVICFACDSRSNSACHAKPSTTVRCTAGNRMPDGCFSLFDVPSNVTERGCMHELTVEGRTICKANTQRCLQCFENHCNQHRVPSSVNRLQSAWLSLCLVSVISTGHMLTY